MSTTTHATPTHPFRLVDWTPVLAATLALAAALALPGCGGTAAARPADPDAARQTLRDTLDAWQHGAAHGSTAVRVADEDWLAGAHLVSYQPGGRDEPVGSHLRCRVVLNLRDARGKTRSVKAVYDVATDPSPSVVRLDFPDKGP